MPLTPAQRFSMRETAQQSTAASGDLIRDDATEYELMLVKLKTDMRRFKDIKSLERRNEIKAEVLPDYFPYIDGVIAGAKGKDKIPQDEVLMTIMTWAVDAKIYDLALQIAEVAIPMGLLMPERFNRSAATFLTEDLSEEVTKLTTLLKQAEQIADEADIEQLTVENNKARNQFLTTLEKLQSIVEGEDMPDQVAAKMHKAFGMALEFLDAKKAAGHLRRALELNPKCGVKKTADKLIKQANA